MSTYIILYAICVIMIVTFSYYIFCINEKSFVFNFKNILIMIAFSILTFLSNYFLTFNMFLKSFASVLIIVCLYFFLTEKNIKSAIFNALLLYCFNIVFDMIIYYFIIFFKTTILVENPNLLIFICSIMNNLLIILIIKIKFTRKIIINFKKNFEKIMNNYLMIITIILFVFINVSCYKLSLLFQSSIYIILLLTGIIGLFMLYNELCEQNKETENYNKYLMEMNSVYGKIIDTDKMEKHNVKNFLLSIKNVGDDNVKKLINSYLNENKKTSIINNELFKLPNSLKGIFGDKLYNYKKIKLIVDNNLNIDPFQKMETKNYAKLCEIIGICLDNSIEAIEKSNDYIYILITEKEENYIISIKNTYKSTINLNELGNKNYSTKKEGSGYGLYSLKKNKTFDVKVSIKNNNFVVDIKIEKSKMRK